MQLKPSIPLKVFGIVIGALLVLPTLVVVPMSFSPGDILSFPPKDSASAGITSSSPNRRGQPPSSKASKLRS